MKPAPFEYHAPKSLDQALELLHDKGPEAKLLAGGQSLVPAMNFRVVQPSALIDLNQVEELDHINTENKKSLRIGAMTRERKLEFDPVVAKWAPLLAEVMPFVAHPQIRNRGTLGGSLANADPAAELPVIMVALEARLKAASTSGERWIEAPKFFSGMFTTDLVPDEMLAEIELPAVPARTGWSFMEIAPRAGDYALMGVAVVLTIDDRAVCQRAHIVFLNAGDGPVEAKEASRLLVGEAIKEGAIDSAAAMASEKEIDPYGNIHASAEFQRHLAKVLTRRALTKALERAQKGFVQ
jgi:carbon-monoxide dehydrogenase medium subunit